MATPLSEKKRAFIDVETTGLSPAKHEMIEFAVVFEDGTSRSFKIQPQHIETAHPKALEVNGYTPERWVDAIPRSEAATIIYDLLKDCVLVGHNVNFDVSFINALLAAEGIERTLGHHNVDTVTLSYHYLAPKGLQKMTLKAVTEFLGLEPEPEVHESLNGALGCRAVYAKLVEMKS